MSDHALFLGMFVWFLLISRLLLFFPVPNYVWLYLLILFPVLWQVFLGLYYLLIYFFRRLLILLPFLLLQASLVLPI
jgi:hypothetical protein